MAPNAYTVTESEPVREVPVVKRPPIKFAWKNLFLLVFLHVGSIYGYYLIFTRQVMLKTYIFAHVVGYMSALGITAGVHRLWSHRAYKAKTPLRIFLMLMNCMAFQGDIFNWSRDHRVHHKHSDTDGDPYNASRGFFFSHIGWVILKKHPDVITKGKKIDCSDILNDPVIKFQLKYYLPLALFMCFVLPTCLSVWLLNETWWHSFIITGLLRYTLSLHSTWLVNSAAHMYGNRPYDGNINPRENLFVSLAAMGEGFHNYHHTFPWDYSTSEFGIKLNLSTGFINLMAKIGQAYDLKSVSPEMLEQRRKRTGEHFNEY